MHEMSRNVFIHSRQFDMIILQGDPKMPSISKEFVHAAYNALSRRCKFNGFKFLHFSSYDTAFSDHMLVANFMYEKTGDKNWMLMYEKTAAHNQFFEIPKEQVGVLNENEVIRLFMGMDGHDVFIDGVIPFIKNGSLDKIPENLLIWSRNDSLEKLLVEDSLNAAC